MSRHFEALVCRKDGGFALAGSSLTGNTWDGALWYFNSWDHYINTPNLELDATPTSTGHSDIAWFGESKLIVASDSGDLGVWHVVAPGNVLECDGHLSDRHNDMVLSVCVTGEGDSGRVISGGGDGRVVVWDMVAAKAIHSYKGHLEWVTDLDHHPTQPNVFISTSMDRHLKIWDMRQNSPVTASINAPREAYCQSLVWSAYDDNLIISGDATGFIHLHDLRDLTEPPLTHQLHSLSVHRLSLSPLMRGLIMSVSDDCTAKLFHLPSNSIVYSSDVHKDFVHGLSWQPDSSSFLTCSWDGSVYSHSFNESMIPPPPPPPLMESTDIDWLADETLLPKEEDLNEEMVLEDDDDNRYPPVKQAIMETTVASGNGVSSSPVTLQTNDSR